MEKALRLELETKIPELVGNIYPTNAPETATKPYLVYTRIRTEKIKTLNGFTGKENLSYMFSIMAQRYGDMVAIRDKVESLLMSLIRTTISEIYIEDLDINNIDEQYEFNLGVNRGIIDFTIYF